MKHSVICIWAMVMPKPCWRWKSLKVVITRNLEATGMVRIQKTWIMRKPSMSMARLAHLSLQCCTCPTLLPYQVCSCVAYLPFLTTVLIDGDWRAIGMGADCWKGKKEDAENAGTKGWQDGIYLQQDGQGKRAPQNVSQMQSVRLHYHDKSSILTWPWLRRQCKMIVSVFHSLHILCNQGSKSQLHFQLVFSLSTMPSFVVCTVQATEIFTVACTFLFCFVD